MDPNQVIRENWLDNQDIPNGGGKGFARRVVYGDGRVETTFYRYGENTPVLTVNGTDPDQAKAFENSKPPGGRTEVPQNGRRMGWDSKTGTYSIDLGPAPTATRPTEPGQVQGVPNDPTIQVQQPDGSWVTKPNPSYRPPAAATATQNIGGTIYERQPDGTWKPAQGLPTDPGQAKPKYTQVKQDEGTGKWYGLTPQGTWEATEGGPGLAPKPPEKPDIRPDGKGGFVRVNPDGTLTAVSAPDGTDPTFTGSPPPWVPQAVRDDLTNYSKQLQDAVGSGAITPQRATQLMQDRYRSAQAAIDNQLEAAKSVYGTEVSQRGQDVSLSNARLSASQAGIKSGLDFFSAVNPRLKEGSTAGADAFLALRRMALADAQQYGGLNEIPRVPIPAALQQAANSITITSPDGTTVTVPHGGGATGSSPVAPAAPAMPQPSPDLPNPNAANLLGSMRAPRPTGFAAVDQISNQIEQGPPLTFSSMEDTFRRAGMDEDAIAASRRNFLGAA